MQLSLVSVGLWVLATTALPTSQNQWKAAGPNDSRSPCPMLNILANHNYIPRDGKSIDLKTLQDGFVQSINAAPDLIAALFAVGVTTSTTGNSSTFNLHDVTQHGVIEHDGSLSRIDTALGDAQPFRADIWAQTTSHFPDGIVTMEQAARARLARIETSKATNPSFSFSNQDVAVSLGETALYLTVLGDGVAGTARRDFIDTFFRQERLPFEAGWGRPTQEITAADVGALRTKLAAVKA